MAGRLAVIGAGLMGSGIAQVAAQAGWQVTLRDLDDAATARGIGRHPEVAGEVRRQGHDRRAETSRRRWAGSPRPPTWTRPPTPTSWSRRSSRSSRSSTRSSGALDKICAPDAVLATNTSAIPVTQIAAVTAAAGVGRRHPLLLAGADDEALRAGPRLQDQRRDAGDRAGVRRGDRQDLRRGQPGHRRLRHHPADRRAGGRGGQAGRVRRGLRRGPRHRLQARLRPRDGPAGHHRPDRRRRAAARRPQHLHRHRGREVLPAGAAAAHGHRR